MKKLFLTSGIIACMACPAFATDNPAGFGPTDVSDPNGLGECVEPTLGVFSGPTRLEAQWEEAFHKITLTDLHGSTTATGGANQVATAGANLPEGYTQHDLIAATPVDSGDPAVYTGRAANGNLNPGIATGSSPFTGGTSAAGIDVNYILNMNIPTAHDQAGNYETITNASSTEANRTFLGFFNTNNQKVIDETNKLTAQGTSDARGATTDLEWTAQYSLASPTNRVEPSIPGYTFDGWATSQNAAASIVETTNDNVTTSATNNLPAIGENTEYWAKWTPNQYTISFDCAFPTTAANVTKVGPDGSSATATSTHNITMDSYTSISETCSAQGHTFTGWTCTSSNSTYPGSLYASGTYSSEATPVTSITPTDMGQNGFTVWLKKSGNVSCTANWTAQTINITWDVNNATEGYSSQNTCTYGGNVTIPTAPTRTGYTFTGWNVDNAGSVVTPVPSQPQP